LTPTWFTEVLRSNGRLDDSTSVASAHVSRFGSDESMMSALYRAVLTYDGPATGPASLIIKLASDSPEQRFVAKITKFYEREIRFYNEVSAKMTVSVPRCYLAEINTEDQSFVLVLDEISGWRQVDQIAGVGYDDAVAALVELADLHAPCWGQDLDSEAETFHRFDSPMLHGLIPDMFEGQWSQARPRVVDELPAEVVDLLDNRRHHTKKMLESMNRPDTFCHGDYRVDNLLFGTDGSVMALDYQLGSIAHGMTDVAYFISQSVDDEVAAKRADELIRVYLGRLATHGIDLGFDEAMTPYRAGLVFYVSIPVGTLTFEGVPPRAEQLAKTMLRRASAEILRTGAHLEFS
jgi:hypothetical protein